MAQWGDIITDAADRRVERKEVRQYVNIKPYVGGDDDVWWWLGDYAEDGPLSIDMSPERHVDVKGNSFTTVGDIITSQTFDTYYVTTGLGNGDHQSTNFFQSWLTEKIFSGKEIDLINSVGFILCWTFLKGKNGNGYATTFFPASSIKLGSVGGAGNSNLSIGITITAGGKLDLGSSTINEQGVLTYASGIK
jgi:hypothetical protein